MNFNHTQQNVYDPSQRTKDNNAQASNENGPDNKQPSALSLIMEGRDPL